MPTRPRGGVVTQRSAKPFTPVQFRAWPPALSEVRGQHVNVKSTEPLGCNLRPIEAAHGLYRSRSLEVFGVLGGLAVIGGSIATVWKWGRGWLSSLRSKLPR